MSMSDTVLAQFDQVAMGTRQHLESIPDEKLGWKPHEKSYSIGELGSHLANLPNWVMATLGQDELDLNPGDGEGGGRQPEYGSSAEMVAALDAHTEAARKTIESASDEAFMAPWTLLNGGEVIFTMPKIAVLRVFVMDHMIHHRGQLTVYLRLLDVPVQQTFGPTADFPDM